MNSGLNLHYRSLSAHPLMQVAIVLALVLAITSSLGSYWERAGTAIVSAWTAATSSPASSSLKVLNGDFTGSAEHVGDGYVLTAAHILQAVDRPVTLISDASKNPRDAEVLWANDDYDVALLRTEPDGLAKRTLSCLLPPIGAAVSWYGNPRYEDFVVAFGQIGSKPRVSQPWKSVFIVNGPIVRGFSGAALQDRSGRMVGMIVGTMTDIVTSANDKKAITGYHGTAMGYAVPGKTICELMGQR